MPDPFHGVIGRHYWESTPYWHARTRAAAGTPNVVIVVLDDVGFAQLGCFGSDIDTPVLDRLAANGLRYANFHTTALCSPTRSCVLTGRNHHANGMGRIIELATGYPGYTARIPRENGFLPEMLVPHGFAAWAVGKWHLTPEDECHVAAPRDRWPLGRGFERFYGFFSGETHQFAPALISDNQQIRPPRSVAEGYHLTEDLVDQSIGLVRDLRAIDVLTPRTGYEFVSQVVAPSEGLTWILADPDPLAAATAPGAAAADLRWILSRDDLPADRLPAVARTAATARRVARLFATLDSYAIETSSLGGGIHEYGGDRRFHWTCRTPCRLRFALRGAPPSFAIGLAAEQESSVVVRASLRAGGPEQHSGATLALGGAHGWQDIWLRAAPGTHTDGEPQSIVEAEITANDPATVFVGGIGPSPGAELEEAEAHDELAFRSEARGRLVLRHADDVARIFENPDALGEAWLATRMVQASDLDDVRHCLVANPRTAVACVADPAALPAAPEDRPPGTLRIEQRDAASLAIAVDAARDALLVVSRLDFPGWRATVDAKETPIVRVHGAMMGIVVPAGRHRVELVYRPRSLLFGALTSLAGVVALLAWSRRYALRRQHGPGSRGVQI